VADEDEQTALYRMYDAGGTLLYVGISLRLLERMAAHRQDKPWWPDIATIRVEYFPDRSEALQAESTAISAECPIYNKIGSDGAARRTAQLSTRTCRFLGESGCMAPDRDEALVLTGSAARPVHWCGGRHGCASPEPLRRYRIGAGNPPSSLIPPY
jgi:predicted GIY-YIG superfamily endonuclease